MLSPVKIPFRWLLILLHPLNLTHAKCIHRCFCSFILLFGQISPNSRDFNEWDVPITLSVAHHCTSCHEDHNFYSNGCNPKTLSPNLRAVCSGPVLTLRVLYRPFKLQNSSLLFENVLQFFMRHSKLRNTRGPKLKQGRRVMNFLSDFKWLIVMPCVAGNWSLGHFDNSLQLSSNRKWCRPFVAKGMFLLSSRCVSAMYTAIDVSVIHISACRGRYCIYQYLFLYWRELFFIKIQAFEASIMASADLLCTIFRSTSDVVFTR